MIITINYYTGKMSVDAEMLILEMPMVNFRKWVKLFVRYGDPADHAAFLQLLEDQIQVNEQVIKDPQTDKKELPHLRRMLKRRMSMKDVMKHGIV